MKPFSITLAVVSLFALISQAEAQVPETSSPVRMQTPKTQVVLLASVNLYHPKILRGQGTGNQYAASFTLDTTDPMQSGVRYRIILLDWRNTVSYVYTSPTEFTLVKGSPVTVSEVFPTPIGLQGTYKALIQVVNPDGLPLASGQVLQVPFASPNQPAFSVESCTTDKLVYEKPSSIALTCTLHGTPSMSSSLTYTIYRGNRPTPYTSKNISVTTKKVFLEIPTPTKASPYTIMVQGYENGAVVGNTSLVKIYVEGNQHDIISLTTDKQAYNEGDTALINAGLNVFYPNPKAVYAKAVMMDKEQSFTCGPSVQSKLIAPGSVSFAIPITKTCREFVLDVVLTDAKGIVLDEKMLEVRGDENSQFVSFLNFILILASCAILLSALAHKVHGTRFTN